MVITLFQNFSKKNNSTKIPSESGLEVNCFLKENTSFEEPHFIVENVDFSANYTYLRALDHYYYIDDKISINNNITELVCSTDPAGSHRSAIRSSTQFVVRSKMSYNKFITDPLATVNPINTSQTVINASAYDGFDPLTGCYILTTSGGNVEAVNFGVTSYLCNDETVRSVLNFMFNDENFSDVLTDGTVKTFFNPFQYVLSLKWLPLSYSTLATGATTQQIVLGWFESGVSAPLINSAGTTFSYTIDLSSIPWRDDFRDFAPGMAEYLIDLPAVGTVTISNGDMYLAYTGTVKTIRADYYVDYATGGVDVKLYASGKFISSHSGSFAVGIQISQLVNDVVGKTISAAGSAANLAMGIVTGGVGGSFSGASGIWDSLTSINQPTQSTSGNQGNRAAYIAHPYPTLYATFTDVVYDPSTYANLAGRPRMQVRSLSGLSGYVQCKNAVIDIAAAPSEKRLIESYLNGGMYLE